jgi:hypothetical protein
MASLLCSSGRVFPPLHYHRRSPIFPPRHDLSSVWELVAAVAVEARAPTVDLPPRPPTVGGTLPLSDSADELPHSPNISLSLSPCFSQVVVTVAATWWWWLWS